MKIYLKTEAEIELLKTGGKKLKSVIERLLPKIKIGMTTGEIDKEATRLILEAGGKPSFQRVNGYKWATCLPINEQVVHTPPTSRILKDGDVLTVDIGMYYEGYHTDYATTFVVGASPRKEVDQFLSVGRETLHKALQEVQVGRHIGHISQAIEKGVKSDGYFIMRELTGHGIGRELHEDPYVFGYLDKPIDKTLKITPGLVLAVEVIYSMGTEEIVYEKGDDWSIKTADNSLSACFEHSVAVTDKKTIILT